MTSPDMLPVPSSAISSAETFVRQQLEGESTGHDWWHATRVRAIAQKIQKNEGGDASIIDMTLLLHDVGDRKVIQQSEDDYQIAEGFLHSQNLPQETTDTIMTIIKNMSYSRSLDNDTTVESLELKIVQDADRLDAIGAIGVARAFAYGGLNERPLYDPEYEPQAFNSRKAYVDSKGSSLHHFDEKLFKLKSGFNTETAQRMADKRDAFMHQFYNQFLDEWNGDK